MSPGTARVAVAPTASVLPRPDVQFPADLRRVPPDRARDVVARRLLARTLLAEVDPAATVTHRPGRAPVVAASSPTSLALSAAEGVVAAAVAPAPVGVDLVTLQSRALARLRRPGTSLFDTAVRWAREEATTKYWAGGGLGTPATSEVYRVDEHLLVVVHDGVGVEFVDVGWRLPNRTPPTVRH